MKKVQALLVASVLTTGSFAGNAVQKDMAVYKDAMPLAPKHTLFVSAEGNYTSNTFNSVSVRGISLGSSDQNWGGRLTAGAVHHSTDNVSYTAELGWGYYGRTRFNSDALGVTNTANITGLDLLVGVDYLVNQFDLFLKVGGMNENVKLQRKTNLGVFVAGGGVTGTSDITTTFSAVAPEVKVGGIWNVTNELGISLAYMYVFGNNVNMNLSPAFDGTTVTLNNSTNSPPVSLSSLSLGLVYNFA